MFSLPLLEGMSPTNIGFPGGPEDKESSCNVGDLSSISGLGRSPGEENGNPLQYSWLEKSHQWRSLACYSPWGGKVSDTTERLHFHFSTNTCWTALFFPFSFLATLLFFFFFNKGWDQFTGVVKVWPSFYKQWHCNGISNFKDDPGKKNLTFYIPFRTKFIGKFLRFCDLQSYSV